MRPIPSNDGVCIVMCQMNTELVTITVQELCFLFFWVFFLNLFYEPHSPRVNNFEIMDTNEIEMEKEFLNFCKKKKKKDYLAFFYKSHKPYKKKSKLLLPYT